MSSATELLLIRHAESAPDRNLPEPAWPLSQNGRQQAATLAEDLAHVPISAIASSPLERARDTVAPLAARRQLTVAVVEDLRERVLSQKRREDWLSLLERTWDDFNLRADGGESSADCQARVVRGLTGWAEEHPGKTIAACSHGNAIALFLNHIEPSFGFEAWREMGNPAIYRCTLLHGRWRWQD